MATTLMDSKAILDGAWNETAKTLLLTPGEHSTPLISTFSQALGLKAAIIIASVHQLTRTNPIKKHGHVWCTTTYEAWVSQLGIGCLSTVKREVKKLEGLGILVTGSFNPHPFDRTRWYRVDYEVLDSLLTLGGRTESGRP
jgi:hypothetical protein